MQQQDVIIVGAGLNGLVCAAYLARAGHSVVVLDQADGEGSNSNAGWLNTQGHLFPSIRDRYCQLDASIVRDLNLGSSGLSILPNGPTVSYFTDGRTFVRHPARHKMFGLLAKASPLDAERYEEFLNYLRIGRQYDNAFCLRSMTEVLEHYFETPSLRDHLIQSSLGNGLCDMGIGPHESTSAMALLGDPIAINDQPAEQRNVLSGRLRGGSGALEHELRNVAAAFGAAIRSDISVSQIKTRNRKVIGVETAGGETISARWVVSSLDFKKTAFALLEPSVFDPKHLDRLHTMTSRGAVAQINMELDGLPTVPGLDGLKHENIGAIHISGGAEKIARAAEEWKVGVVSEHLPVEVNILNASTDMDRKDQKALAVAYAYFVPAYPRLGQWDEAARYALGTRVLDTISFALPTFGKLVQNIETVTPDLFESTLSAAGGNLQGNSTSLDMTRLPRSADSKLQSTRLVDGLLVCGAGSSNFPYASGIAGRRAASRIHFGRGGEERL